MLEHLSKPQFGGLKLDGVQQALDLKYQNIDPRGIAPISPYALQSK